MTQLSNTKFQNKLKLMDKKEICKNLNVTRQAVELWINKRVLPSRDRVIKLVDEYGFTYSDFFEEEENLLD